MINGKEVKMRKKELAHPLRLVYTISFPSSISAIGSI